MVCRKCSYFPCSREECEIDNESCQHFKSVTNKSIEDIDICNKM